MPYKIKVVEGQDYGTGASNIIRKIEHGGMTIHGIVLNMTSKENTVTNPTLANMMTQMATNIQILLGGDVVFDMSATDLQRLIDQLGIRLNYVRGGGTDTRIQRTMMFVPLGRINTRRTRDVYERILDPQLGIRTSKDVYLKLIVPADANNINNRLLNATALLSTLPTQGYISRLTSTVTPRATGWAADGSKFALPAGTSLYDFLFFQTTNIADGVTADTVTLEQLELEIDSFKLIEGRPQSELFQTEMEQENASNEEYLYKQYDPPVPIQKSGALTWNGGDTQILRLIIGYVAPNPP